MGEMQTITINGKKYEIEGHPPYLSDQGTWMVYDTKANTYVDTQISGVGHDYVLTEGDKNDIAKRNALIVTVQDNFASHTPAEVFAHVKSGGSAVMLVGNGGAVVPLATASENYCEFGGTINVEEDIASYYLLYEDKEVEEMTGTYARSEWVSKALKERPKMLVVTLDFGSYDASHTATQIHDHVKSGGTAVLDLAGNEKYAPGGFGGIYPLVESVNTLATFGFFNANVQILMSIQIDEAGGFEFFGPELLATVGRVEAAVGHKITTPAKAEVGQTIVVKSVDAKGKPTKWEAVDLPSGVSSWADIPGKPFTTVGGDTLTWDGNTEGLENIDGMLFKVSDCTPTLEDIANGYTIVLSDGNTVNETGMPAGTNEIGYYVGEFVWILPEDFTSESTTLTKGTYFLSATSGEEILSISSLTIPGYTGFTTEKIDPKVLPDALQFGDELKEVVPLGDVQLVYDETEGGAAVSIPFADSLSAGDVMKVMWDGVEYICPVNLDFGLPVFGNMGYLDGVDTGEPFYGALTDGSLGIVEPTTTEAVVRSIAIDLVKVNKLDDKYINKQKVFYYNPDQDYLYIDQGCSTKVTSEQLLEAFKSSPVVLAGTSYGLVMGYCLPLGCFIGNGYAMVYAVYTMTTVGEPVYKTFYTAEYTA